MIAISRGRSSQFPLKMRVERRILLWYKPLTKAHPNADASIITRGSQIRQTA
jgi:hypothetical protein